MIADRRGGGWSRRLLVLLRGAHREAEGGQEQGQAASHAGPPWMLPPGGLDASRTSAMIPGVMGQADAEPARLFLECAMQEAEVHSCASGEALVFSTRSPAAQHANEDAAAPIPLDP